MTSVNNEGALQPQAGEPKTMENPPVLPPPPPLPPAPKNRYRGMIYLTFFILFVALAWFLLWFFVLRFREYTDNAYANGSMINVTSVISGTPIALFADDTDLVLQGQLLVMLDETPFLLAYEKELATLATTALQVSQYVNQVKAAIANVQSKRTIYERLRYDFENRQQLIDSQAVSGEDFTHAKDTMRTAEMDLKQALAQLNVSIDLAGNIVDKTGKTKKPIEEHPLIEAQRKAVRQAYYNLKHCAILAPVTGYIAQRNVDVGQWVTPTTYMMAVIPIDYMWIDANFKETQLTNMRVGQKAKVYIDIYGSGVEYEGKVLGIASGTGSVFSLIPPQNATGNWIKIVQRLPVRISVDPQTMKKYPLRLGISSEVYVDITDTDLPMLSQVPATKLLTNTHVFNLDFSEVDKTMDEIIKENLNQTNI